MKAILNLVQSAPCRIEVDFQSPDGQAYNSTIKLKAKHEEPTELPLYTCKDDVCGEVRVIPIPGKKVDHSGIKVQLIGRIDLVSEGRAHNDFINLVRDLAPPGDLSFPQNFKFSFNSVDLQNDSYLGSQVKCKYFLRITVTGKGMLADTRRDVPFWVRNYQPVIPPEAPIKMEVGIEDCLHIEFEYNKAAYHLTDVVVGRINFLLVRIKLKTMELEIRRKETAGVGAAAHLETDVLAKYEIMDGTTVRGETIPIRFYLSPYELTPTYKDVHNKFSVRYYINLVLIDEEERRYFKQQEITLYRIEAEKARVRTTRMDI